MGEFLGSCPGKAANTCRSRTQSLDRYVSEADECPKCVQILALPDTSTDYQIWGIIATGFDLVKVFEVHFLALYGGGVLSHDSKHVT